MGDQVVQIKYFYKVDKFPLERINYLYLIYVADLDKTAIDEKVLSEELPKELPYDAPILMVIGKKVVVLVPVDALNKMSLETS